jgi:hypothetical protein
MARRIHEEIPIQVGPVVHLAQRPRVQAVEPLPTDLPYAHETGGTEDLQVLRDRRLRHPEGARKARDGVFGCAQLVEEGAAGGVGNGAEDVARLNRRHGRILISESLCVKGPQQHLCQL